MSSNNILQTVRDFSDKELESTKSFLKKIYEKYSKEKKRIYEEYDIDNTLRFNIFESISEKYYMENFHSDILFTILNPETPEIGRKYFVEEFVKFLGIETEFDCTKDFEVTREEARIDLLIKNDKQAIIIENKINYAKDQGNQLVRYMEYVKEELGLEIASVVYLTLIDDKKKPPSEKGKDGYDSDFKTYADMLKDKNAVVLQCVYAVDSKKSLAKDFLPHCIERLRKEEPQADNVRVADVYINQYKTVLEHLGGKAYMTPTDKELIKEIYSSKDEFDAANDFAEFWKNRKEILGKIILGKIMEEFPNKEVKKPKSLKGFSGCCTWESNFAYAKIYWDGERQIGFASQEGKKFTKAHQEELKKIISKIPNKEGSLNEDKEWVWCDIKNSKSFFDDVIKGLKILFEAK